MIRSIVSSPLIAVVYRTTIQRTRNPAKYKPRTNQTPTTTAGYCGVAGEAPAKLSSEHVSLNTSEHVSLKDDQLLLSVRFRTNETSHYPYVWLRDNCQCQRCFHPTTQSRLLLMADLDLKIKPTKAEIRDVGQSVVLHWSDGHKSVYNSAWLQERAFTDRAHNHRAKTYGKTHVKWGAEMKDALTYFDYEKVMEEDTVLLDWLTQMETYGISMLTNAMKASSLLELSDRVGLFRKTNYGETFEVKSKENPSNLAYTSAPLGLHCDLPFYQAIPGIQFLHFVHNTTKGGENQFADASHAADQLKKMRPDLHHLLSTTLVDFYDIGKDYFNFHMVHRHPTIRHDYQGNVTGIAYNNQVRDSFLNVPLEKVAPLYEGLKMLNDIMYDRKNRIDIAMKTGHIVVFDNIRILHGRSVFGPGERHLVGAYMDWCDVRSKIRLLRQRLGVE